MKPHIVCPHCGDGDGFECEHILSGELRKFGPWHCDKCGHSITGQMTTDGLEIEKSAERMIDTADLLVLRPQDKPVYFIVKGMRFEGVQWPRDEERDENDSNQFFYEEHSCPTNWFRPTTVYVGGDDDPHGLIEFVATRDWATFPADEVVSPNDHDRSMVEFIEEHAKVKA